MNNLTTRKIVLGMLLTLVLAFSVQGTADALALNPGADESDLSTLSIGESITLSNISETANVANARESVSISVRGGSATFPRPDDTSRTTNSYAWTETANDTSETIGSTSSIDITVGSAGEVTVTVSYTETYSDNGVNRARNASFVRTYYVVRDRLDVSLSDTIRLRGVTNGVGHPYDHRQDIQIYAGDNRHNEVTYTTDTTDGGSGTFYIKEGNRYSILTSGAETSSGAEVWLSMGTRTVTSGALNDRPDTGTTNTVTAEVTGNGNETTGLYIYGRPTLIVSTGTNDPALNTDPQPLEDDPGREITDAIKAEIRDETNARTAVEGVPIKFDVADKSVTGGYLIPQEETGDPPIVDSSNNVITNPPATARTLNVRTGGTNDRATVDFQFGTASGKSEITVSALGMTKEVEVTVTGDDTTTLSESTNTRRSGNSDLFDLIALVEENGVGQPNVVVTFRTGRGTLTSTPADATETTATDDTNDDLVPNSGRIITETTDAAGRAHVIYNIGSNTGRQEIDASIYDSDSTLRREVAFVVNGPAQQVDPGTGTETGTTLSVSSRSISGAPGSSPSFSVTAPANARVTVGRLTDSFITAGGQASPGIFTGSQNVSLTLPSTARSYTLTVDSGTQSIRITITVEAETPGDTTTEGTLSLDVPASGAAGDRLLVTITVDPAAAINVTLGTTGGIGTLSRSTVATNSSGVGTATLTLGAAGSTGFVTASATEYDTRRLRVTVTGNPADSLSITSGSNQRGAPDDELDNPFVVTVLDEDNDPVSGVAVTFSVISGGGSLSATSVQTNSRGRASTVLTLGDDPGRNSVRARAAGVSRTVTFNATATGAAAELVIDSGNNQRGALNEELDDSLIVQVLDDDGNGVNDVSVLFRVTPGQGRLSQLGNGSAVRDRTDRRGFAEADFTPMGAGTITITARSGSLDPVTFTVTTGPPPASLDIVSGDNQAGTPGDALADPLVVEVQDAEGDAVDGVTVTFEVTAGGGSLSATTATTNASGRAQTTLTLGGERGINSVQASVSDLDPVTFNTSIDAVVHVAAANRPVMYWIDAGMLYRLAGAKAETDRCKCERCRC